MGGVRAAPCRSACWRARSSSSTTCATSTPTAAPASARSRCGSGASARACCTPRCSSLAFVDRAAAVARSASMTAWLLLTWLAIAARACAVVRVVRTRTDGPSLNGALARTGALAAASSACCSAPGSSPAAGSAVKLDARAVARCGSATPLQTAYGDARRARAARRDADRRRRRRGPRRGGAAASPTTASRSSACWPALERYAPTSLARRRAAPRRAAARRLPRRRRPAGRRSRRSTSRCGTAPGAARAGRSRALLTDAPAPRGRRSTRRIAARRPAPAPPSRPRAAVRRRLRLREAEGRRRRRRGARRRGARGGRARARAAPRRQRRLERRAGRAHDRARSRPPGSSSSRSPCTASQAVRAGARARRRCASRSTRRPREPGALGAGVADAVCLKISRCGGIGGLLAAATLVRASGAEVYLASTYDGPLGIAAALHAAAALASRGPLPACGLATLALFDGARGSAARRATGAIAVPAAPGLGVEPASSFERRRDAPRGFSSARRVAGGRARSSSPAGSARHARAQRHVNFASRSPASTVTGIASSPSRSHSGAIAPGAEAAQAPPRARAGRCGAGRRAPARRPRAGRRANSGCVRQRSMKPSIGSRLERAGERARRRRGARRARRVLDPGARGDEHEPRDALGRRERDVQRDAPAHRVAAEREALRARASSTRARRTPAKRDRRRARRPRRRAPGGRARAAGSVPGPAAPTTRRPTRGACRRSRAAGRRVSGTRPIL